MSPEQFEELLKDVQAALDFAMSLIDKWKPVLIQETNTLTPEQEERLRALVEPFQKFVDS